MQKEFIVGPHLVCQWYLSAQSHLFWLYLRTLVVSKHQFTGVQVRSAIQGKLVLDVERAETDLILELAQETNVGYVWKCEAKSAIETRFWRFSIGHENDQFRVVGHIAAIVLLL